MAIAVLAKPSAVVLPLLAGILQVVALRQSWRQALPWLASWVALGSVMLAVTWSQQEEKIIETVPLPMRPLLALDALAFYGLKTLVPWPLVADYGWRPSLLTGQWWYYVIWVVPVALAVWLIVRRRRDEWAVGTLLFTAALLPVLGLVPFGFQYVSTVADRYAYLSMFGVAWIITGLLARHWRPATIGLAIAVTVVLAGLSTWQVGVWQNDKTLFDHTAKVNDRSFAAMTNLGRWEATHGQHDKAIDYYRKSLLLRENPVTHRCLGQSLMVQRQYAQAVPHLARAAELNVLDTEALILCGEALLAIGKLPEARQQFEAALRRAPTSVLAIAGIGKVLAEKGDYVGAEAQFRKAVAVDERAPQPSGADAHFALAYLLSNRGRWDEAAEEYLVVIQRRPHDAKARLKLAAVTLQAGRATDAAEMFAALVHAQPNLVDAYEGLAQSLLALGKTAPALDQYRHGIARQPQWIAGQLSLAWLLATLPDGQFRNASEALSLAERACAATNQRIPLAFDVLAAARAEAGDFAGAAQAADQALALAAGKLAPQQASEIEARRDLYRAGKPYRKAPANWAASTPPGNLTAP
ncbi:MAG: tetratricopeptide repeat protein [Pirellulales bacterium]